MKTKGEYCIITIDQATIKLILQALSQGEKVEIAPTKDGIKVFRVKRKEIRPTRE